jgi:hypothetical protein
VPSPDEAESRERVTAYVVEALGADVAAELQAAGADLELDELLEAVASRA